MRIVIVGAGFTGSELARTLTSNGASVTLIDSDEEVVRHVSGSVDCAVMCADGNDLSVLEQAGIANADAIVCVTKSDEINMITCSLVNEAYPAVTKIARVRNYAYYAKKMYGIDWMIHPDVEAADAIVEAVRHGAAGEVLSFDDSDYVLSRVTVAENSKICHKRLSALRSLSTARFIIAYIEAESEASGQEGGEALLPTGNTVITAGSTLGIVVKKEDTKDVFALCGTEQKELKNIAIVGAGRIGIIIAERLLESSKAPPSSHKESIASFILKHFKGKGKAPQFKRNIVMIDSDERLANKAAAQFDKTARVFCADATDESFLSEEGITQFDLAICATHNHELNMVLAAYLESLGVGQSVSLVDSSAFAAIARRLGVDVAVPLRDTIVDSILSHLRGKGVFGVHTVASGDMEIIECTVSSPAVIGKTLKELSKPGIFLLLLVKHTVKESAIDGNTSGAVSGGNTAEGEAKYEIPTGDTMLSKGDSCILIVQSVQSGAVVAMFSGAK